MNNLNTYYIFFDRGQFIAYRAKEYHLALDFARKQSLGKFTID